MMGESITLSLIVGRSQLLEFKSGLSLHEGTTGICWGRGAIGSRSHSRSGKQLIGLLRIIIKLTIVKSELAVLQLLYC